jgi:hypothetical protein
MDIDDVIKLREHFYDPSKMKEFDTTDPGLSLVKGFSLNRNEFIKAMDDVIGSSLMSLCSAKLFDTLDNDGNGFLVWEEVLDAIIEKVETPLGGLEQWAPIDPNVSIYEIPHAHVSQLL